MLNNNNPPIRYQYSKSEPDSIKFSQSNPLNKVLLNNSRYTDICWQDICSKITNINQEIFFDKVSTIEQELQHTKTESLSESKPYLSCFAENQSPNYSKKKELYTTTFSSKYFQKLRSKTCRLRKDRISILKLKSLISRENMNILPTEVQQNLIQLMPECDKVLEDHNQSDESDVFSLSKTSLNNEFFNRALSNFLLKVTNKKSMISIESFINNIKCRSKISEPTDMLSTKISDNCTYFDPENDKSPNISSSPSPSSSSFCSSNRVTTIRKLDCGFNIIADNCSKSSDIILEESLLSSCINNNNNNPLNCELPINHHTKEEKFVSDNSYSSHSIKFDSESNRKYSDKVKVEESVGVYINQNNISLPFCSDNIDSSKISKYKRRNSGITLAPTPNKRPTRSTAGQLPARLKSTSPPPPPSSATAAMVQGTASSQCSHLSLINKPLSVRTKHKEKRESRSSDSMRNSSVNIVNETKFSSTNCDSILFNLRNKLSKRLQKNSQKYFSDTFSTDESVLTVSSDANCLNTKSPGSLSPGSDKLSFVNSPSSKSGQNHFRQLKSKNLFYENQAPNSPQWSFSSEFTSQSSVESVLSQKNIRIEQDEANGFDNLLEDMDCEEMPPPRRTLTVAAMREKMRAKKMAKEEKRKDVDRDSCSLDTDTMGVESKMLDLTVVKQSHSSTMSTMMSMSRENPSDETDDENMSHEFDSFLIDDHEIDDYHVEIDDKILNYSEDLDDLLLTGGNESLLEIIMKDPDAIEITNENFCSINSENQIPGSIQSSLSNYSSSDSKNLPTLLDFNISHSGAFNCAAAHNFTTISKNIDKPSISDAASFSEKIDNPNPILLSQTLTSVIQKVSNNIQSSKDVSANIKGSLPNAYLVDGNGLADALKLIQSLNPGAKVATQQFYLVNSGPQLILCQTPPTQACSTRPVNSKSPIKSVMNTTHITCSTSSSNSSNTLSSSSSSSVVTPFIRNIFNSNITTTASNHNHINNPNHHDTNNPSGPSQNLSTSSSSMSPNVVITSSKSSSSVTSSSNQTTPMLSSTISVLPQFSAFNSKTQNLYSVNSNFANKIITPIANLGCKLSNNTNNVQYTTTTTISSSSTNVIQQGPTFVGGGSGGCGTGSSGGGGGGGNQKSPILSNSHTSNTLGIRLQLAQNFQHHSHQPVSILQPSPNSVIPTLMNQQLQFISPQPNSNISLITQPQPMSKLVLLCPNLNCQPIGSGSTGAGSGNAGGGSSDIVGSALKAADPQQQHQHQQQLIFVSPQKDQTNPISLTTNSPSFQVLNGPNFWQQINPNFGTILGSTNTNNLVLMNPQTLNQQSFSFNYQPQSQIIAANNLVIMSSNNFTNNHQQQPSSINPTNQKSNTTAITTNHHSHHSQHHNHNQSKSIINNAVKNSLTINVTNNKSDEDNLVNVGKTQSSASAAVVAASTALNLNSNSSHNSSCVELLSNSSSSANSKVSFDEKSSCQLSKSYSENLTDSDQEKSINSPQFQMLASGDLSTHLIVNTEIDSFRSGGGGGGGGGSGCGGAGGGGGGGSVGNVGGTQLSVMDDKCKMHLTVDIDSPTSPSNCVYQNKISRRSMDNNCLSTSSQNDDSNVIQSPATDYDQSDFEIPCVYSEKLQIRQISLIADNNDDSGDEKHKDIIYDSS